MPNCAEETRGCTDICCIAVSGVPGAEKVAPSGVVPDTPDAKLQSEEARTTTELIWCSDTPVMYGAMTQSDSTSDSEWR